MKTSAFETVLDLGVVCGGAQGDLGKCVDDIIPWTLGGALAGASGGLGTIGLGALGGGGAAALTSVNCGNGVDSPATMLRKDVGNFFHNLTTPIGDDLRQAAQGLRK